MCFLSKFSSSLILVQLGQPWGCARAGLTVVERWGGLEECQGLQSEASQACPGEYWQPWIVESFRNCMGIHYPQG
jgi:hypothetical protein